MGMDSGERVPQYKLPKVTMSGDNGEFKLLDLTAEKGEDNKYPQRDLGKSIDGVILKMRWQLQRYEEGKNGTNSTFYSSTEYDNKFKDDVTVFPTKDKGNAVAMKEKHNLGTVRIVYFYMPKEKQIVRLVVKASALSGDKNPDSETQLGLFEYLDEYANTETLPCEFITTCTGVHRADPNGNKRKDYFAMTFAAGRKLTESEFAKVEAMMLDVNEKTMSPKPIEDEMEQQDKALDEALASEDDIASSIPF